MHLVGLTMRTESKLDGLIDVVLFSCLFSCFDTILPLQLRVSQSSGDEAIKQQIRTEAKAVFIACHAEFAKLFREVF